ncbi:MAG: ATP-binding protein [Bacteroidetes bacterium HGW-Bacteroidetes-21]|nr:MAG: ATP-binding protein [Bacteroidetes bacterium HGW-Bacteroidetes-21]
MSFASKMENINIIEKIVDEMSAQYNFGTEIYGNILVAAVEAVNNAIIHGNKINEQKNVHVKLEIDNDLLKIYVGDEGEGFDFEKLPDPTLPENIEKPHGRGIFLIKHLADELKFNVTGTELEMTFKLH